MNPKTVAKPAVPKTAIPIIVDAKLPDVMRIKYPVGSPLMLLNLMQLAMASQPAAAARMKKKTGKIANPRLFTQDKMIVKMSAIPARAHTATTPMDNGKWSILK